ncbi:hypothetical protein ACFTXM_42070 [Streptomyces sp. NPDC056930]|uniref:hypothetical protein n=1 Tax=Streptomyces sp. NPDC056930 TaxID=3345967 RepID=UPI003631C5FA
MFCTPSAVPDVLSSTGAVIGGLHLLTDGKWLWYSDLAHYVEHYHVALDPRFVEHVQSNGWAVPEPTDSDLDAMLTVLIEDELGQGGVRGRKASPQRQATGAALRVERSAARRPEGDDAAEM